MENVDLSDFFKTRAEAQDFQVRISAIQEKIFEINFNFENALVEQFGIEKKEKFLALVRENKIDINTPENLSNFVQSILDKISALPVISITLAFEPDNQTLKMISEWFLLNTHKQYVFDLKVDRELIAGAALYSGGKFWDYSLKPKFNQILQGVLGQNPQEVNTSTTQQDDSSTGVHQSEEHMTFGR